MTTRDVQLGQLALSKAGRDKGKGYIIVKILDDTFVSLVDGNLRKIASPKRKNIKHLQVTAKVATEVKEKLLTGAKLEDEQVKQAISELMNSPSL